MIKKSKMAKACDIPMSVKKAVYERDGGRCVLCGQQGAPNAHYIPRARGGLGIEQNIVTLCMDCHTRYDQSEHRKLYGDRIKEYLEDHYTDWDENDLIFRKW